MCHSVRRRALVVSFITVGVFYTALVLPQNHISEQNNDTLQNNVLKRQHNNSNKIFNRNYSFNHLLGNGILVAQNNSGVSLTRINRPGDRATVSQPHESKNDTIRKLDRRKSKNLSVLKHVTDRQHHNSIGSTNNSNAQINAHPNLTIVSALLDVGRGNWSSWQRPISVYVQYLENVAHLKVPLLIYVNDASAIETIKRIRNDTSIYKTIIRPLHFEQLPYARLMERVKTIISNEQRNWKSEWSYDMQTHPEASIPEYDILMNSKPYLLSVIANENPFNTQQFAWLDAGYGHGDSGLFPPDFTWNPQFVANKISVVLRRGYGPEHLNIQQLYRQGLAPIAGGFIGAPDRDTMLRFHSYFDVLFRDYISKGFIDDDQTTMALLMGKQPDLFDTKIGDFFDCFKLW